MLEVVSLSPENELPIGVHLRELIAAEWRDLAGTASDDYVRIFAGAHLSVEIDLIVEIHLARPRPVASVTMRDGTCAHNAWVRCGILAIEVKQQSRERFEMAGSEIFPIYGREPSKRSVAKQVSDATIAVQDFMRRYSDERVYVHGLGWLTDVPEHDLLAAPHYIVGRETSWSSLLQAAATRSSALFADPPPPYRAAVAALGSALTNRRRLAPRDRAAVDRLTNATIADGKFDAIREALGVRQVRLAGRAGSGKSTTIALIAEYIARTRQERLLVLTYHHALCHEIERLVRSIVNDDAMVDRCVRVATLVDFLADACAELGGAVPCVDGHIDYARVDDAFRAFLAAEPIEERRSEAVVLEQIEPERFGFDFVCVDEAQDCLDSERDFLRVLYPPERIVLADGLDQLVRRHTPCDWTTGLRPNARLHVDLAQSLRMSRNLAEFATQAARAMGSSGWRVSPHPDLSGGRIIVQTHGYDETLLRELLTSLDDSALPRKDLLVCVPPSDVTTDGVRRSARTGVALERLGVRVWDGCDEAVRRGEFARLDQVRVVQ